MRVRQAGGGAAERRGGAGVVHLNGAEVVAQQLVARAFARARYPRPALSDCLLRAFRRTPRHI